MNRLRIRITKVENGWTIVASTSLFSSKNYVAATKEAIIAALTTIVNESVQ